MNPALTKINFANRRWTLIESSAHTHGELFIVDSHHVTSPLLFTSHLSPDISQLTFQISHGGLKFWCDSIPPRAGVIDTAEILETHILWVHQVRDISIVCYLID